MDKKIQVLQGLQGIFLLFNCQTPGKTAAGGNLKKIPEYRIGELYKRN